MNKETEAIYSSTGNLGVSRRQYGRLYVNGTKVSSDPEEFGRNFQRLVAIGERFSHKIGRIVFRGVVTEEVMAHVLSSQLRTNLEVALPLQEFTGDTSWLMYMAKNNLGRDQIVQTATMIRDTERERQSPVLPEDRVEALVRRGYVFTDSISENQVDQIYALWGETFGWQRHEVENLRKRLNSASRGVRMGRNVWLSAISDNDGVVVSVATAERLSIPGTQGLLDLVESTEWRTRDECEGQGLMTANLVMLNTQILSDLHNSPNGSPLIYAECNFQSRSDRAGNGAGFRIPIRTQDGYPAAHILVQNVGVGDGRTGLEGKLRDFTFMYVPTRTIQTQYSQSQLVSMMRFIRT